MSRVNEPASEVLPFWKHPELRPSPRIRSLLDGVYQTSWSHLAPGLQRALRRAIQQLMQAAPAESPEPGLAEAGARRIADRGRSFAEELRQRLQLELLVLAAGPSESLPPSLAALVANTQPREHHSEPDEDWLHGEQMLLSQICARVETQAGMPLSALAWRLAVIQGSAPLDTGQMVLGPHWLTKRIEQVLGMLSPVPRHRLLLLRCLDQELFSSLPAMIAAVDRFLSGQRILPRIEEYLSADEARIARARSTRRRAAQPQSAAIERHDGHTPPPPAVRGDTAMEAKSAADPAPRWNDTQADTGSPFWTGPAARALRELSNDRERSELLAIADQPKDLQPTLDPRTVARIWEWFGRRRAAAMPGGPDSHCRTVASRDVVAALHKLQRRHKRHQPVLLSDEGGRASDLRRELLNELRDISPQEAPRLAEPDAHVIELVGRLFDRLLERWKPTSRVHVLLERMEAPIAKAALRDKSFFISPEQPARRFLNALASACEHWIEDEEQDQTVVERLESTVDQFCQAYEEDLASFALALGELERHLAALRKRAELAIRRHVDALRGRERLELARMAAREIVGEILDRFHPHALIAGFLRNAWTDALTLAILRNGIDSQDTAERAEVAARLAAISPSPGARRSAAEIHAVNRPASEQGTPQPSTRAPPTPSESLAEQNPDRPSKLAKIEYAIRAGLTATGVHDDIVQNLLTELHALSLGPEEVDRSAFPQLADLAQRKERLGCGGDTDPPTSPANRDLSISNAKDFRQASHSPALQVGQWLQREYEDGTRRRRLVAWRSHVCDRVLLIDIRGIRAENAAWSEIAGKVSSCESPSDCPGPVDCALQKLFAPDLNA